MLTETFVFYSLKGQSIQRSHLKLKRTVTDGRPILLQLAQLTSLVEGITKLLAQEYSDLTQAASSQTLTLREVGTDDVEKGSLEDAIGRHRPTTRRKNLQKDRYCGLGEKFEV